MRKEHAAMATVLAPPVPSTDATELRPPRDDELATMQTIWSLSQDEDDLPGRPVGGWWSIADWATTIRALVLDGRLIGLVGVEYGPGALAAEARLALAPLHRHPESAARLVRAASDLARALGAAEEWLSVPATARWAQVAARAGGFRPCRARHLMLRAPGALPLVAPAVSGTTIRPLRTGEESALLAALGHAWAGTWNFRGITAAMLADDLRGQRAGMLVAVETAAAGRIVGTVQARFDPAARNPDGGPYAWISNLTTDHAWRGRGLGRALLAAGLDHLRGRGAASVALGVDGGAAAPLALYRSADFASFSTTEVWERRLGPASAAN
jgi:mycothiol synthase